MADDRPVNLAVLGLGFMGSTHLKSLQSVPGARLAAVFDVDETRLSGDLTSVGGNIGAPGGRMDFSSAKKYRDLGALLADSEIDAVDICLPTDQHTATAIAALQAGKHVLVEKPLALDGPSADRVVAEAARSNRVLMTAHVLRFWPSYTALCDAVRQGHLGPVRFAAFRRRCAAPAWGGWLLDPSRSGGGAFDLLIHDVDMSLHLFGKPAFLSAIGWLDPAAGIDCLDAQLEYTDGSVASISGGWHNTGKFPFSMEYTVTFDGGTIDYHSSLRNPTLYTSTGGEQTIGSDTGDGYAAEIGYFIDCCRNGRTPELCPPRESADSVKLMRLILEARHRKGEKLPCRI